MWTARPADGLGLPPRQMVRGLFLGDSGDVPAVIKPSSHLALECRHRGPFAKAAFPDDNDTPAHQFQQALIFGIAAPVAFNLRSPPFRFRFWHFEARASRMAVPEATVDEDHGAILGQDEVGFAGQGFVFRAVHREPVAEPVEHRAQGQFRLRVASPDAGHDLGAFFRSEDVGHGE